MLDATLNCYLRPDRFDELPFEPSLKKSGAEAFLVSLLKGTLKDIPGMEVIRSLSSFRYCYYDVCIWMDVTMMYVYGWMLL